MELFRGRQPVEDFVARTATAFAARLRKSEGIPGLFDARELIRLAKGGRVSASEAHQQAGAFGHSRASYAADITESGCNTDDKKWYHYRVMADQVERLDAAISNASPEVELVNSFPALAEQFLLLRETSPGGNVLPLIDLYRRYCAEWRTFDGWRSESPLADHVHHHG
ncbi:MAG: hypothetical protein ABJC26_08295 [Gemmatimonadaceae bacterium]